MAAQEKYLHITMEFICNMLIVNFRRAGSSGRNRSLNKFVVNSKPRLGRVVAVGKQDMLLKR